MMFRQCLGRLATLKGFILLGALLFHYCAANTAALLGAAAASIPHVALTALGAGAAAWLLLSAADWVVHQGDARNQVAGDPLSWNRASTSGTTHFFVILLLLGYPSFEHASDLSPLTLALAGVAAGTLGVTAHLSVFWELRRADTDRVPDGLRMEQQIWGSIFGGAVAWTGLLIGGALLALAAGAFGNSVRQLLPASAPSVVVKLLANQGLPVGYAIAAVILWVLRPLHRRMEQIADAIDPPTPDAPR